MSSAQFKFGDRVRKIGQRDIFLVTGIEPSGQIQLAAFNWKTSAKAKDLELA